MDNQSMQSRIIGLHYPRSLWCLSSIGERRHAPSWLRFCLLESCCCCKGLSGLCTRSGRGSYESEPAERAV